MSKDLGGLKGYIVYYGPWQIPVCAKHVLCPDGKRRYVKLAQEPDTYFSIPGSVQVYDKAEHKQKSVSGFVASRRYPNDGDLEFIPYTYGKNAYLFCERTSEHEDS